MADQPTIHALIVQAMDDTDDPHPRDVAERVIQALPKSRYEEALRESLWLLVRNTSARSHCTNDPQAGSAPGRPHAEASAHVGAMGAARWSAWIRERVSVGAGIYKFLGDCDRADVEHLATVRREHAKANAEAADRFDHLADLMRRHRASVVADLPAAAIAEVAP